MNTSTIIKEKFEAKIIENNIYYIKYYDKAELTVDDMKSCFEAYTLLSKGQKLKVIIEFGTLCIIDTKAREYAQDNKLPALAEVLIMKTIAYRVLAVLYFKFRVQKHPIKIFKNFDKGIAWLNTIN